MPTEDLAYAKYYENYSVHFLSLVFKNNISLQVITLKLKEITLFAQTHKQIISRK